MSLTPSQLAALKSLGMEVERQTPPALRLQSGPVPGAPLTIEEIKQLAPSTTLAGILRRIELLEIYVSQNPDDEDGAEELEDAIELKAMYDMEGNDDWADGEDEEEPIHYCSECGHKDGHHDINCSAYPDDMLL